MDTPHCGNDTWETCKLSSLHLGDTGFSVNFMLRNQAVGIYLGIYEDTHQSKGNMIAEVFDCVKIKMDIVCISSGARTMECRPI